MLPAYLVAALSFGVVMLVMALLASILYGVRFVLLRRAREAQPPVDPATEVDEETLVVLSAAAHAALGAPVRVHHVHLRRASEQERWSRAGRMDIMLSHRVSPSR